jgi:hypothetical protein
MFFFTRVLFIKYGIQMAAPIIERRNRLSRPPYPMVLYIGGLQYDVFRNHMKEHVITHTRPIMNFGENIAPLVSAE